MPLLTQIPLDPKDQPRYSSTQIHDYFKRIKLPQKYLDSPLLSDPSHAKSKYPYGLPFLQALVRHHTSSVPFENLVLHYAVNKRVTLNGSDLYKKIVQQGYGGRCMENNTLFATVLRTLGYEVRNCGGRVARTMCPFPEARQYQSNTYDGWNHMLNLVPLDGEWYVVDVGMGAMGPNMPYPLKDGFETTSVAPRKIRLQLRPIAESYASSMPRPKLWCYDTCNDPVPEDDRNEWTPVYCFTETEFLPQDYQVMSWFTSSHDDSFFTKYIMCMKMIMGEGEDEEKLIGNITIFKNTVRETIGNNRKVLKECVTEDDRVLALKELFGVELSDEQRNAMPLDRRLG